jgi:hypothetical protein
MFDRFNLWVGSLNARTQDLKNESGQTFVETRSATCTDERALAPCEAFRRRFLL